MRLVDFDQDKIDATKIVALTNQLKQDVETQAIDVQKFTVDELLDYFQKYDIIFDVTDLYNMIKVPPMKDVIKNIQGDKVVFVTHDKDDALDVPKDDQKKVVAQMAKSAMK
jgi:hypothetical protein